MQTCQWAMIGPCARLWTPLTKKEMFRRLDSNDFICINSDLNHYRDSESTKKRLTEKLKES